MYGLDGTEHPVSFPDGAEYLQSLDPEKDFRAVTVADYTFIVNRSVVVEENLTLSPERPPEAIVVVKNGLYGKTYSVTLNGNTYSFTTPNGTTAADMPQTATDYIASQLATRINAAVDTHGVTCSLAGSVLYLTKAEDFNVTTSDGYGNTAMYPIKGKIQRFADLPNNAAFADFTVEIVGDKTSEFDNYWVKFDKTENSSGVWRETVQPGISVGFMPGTMPFALVREADGTFSFKALSWGTRKVGDEGSAPHPSFVGGSIQDVFFYRNRLGFIVDEAVCFSEAGEFFNFYPSTVTDLLDSDRIDVQVSHTKVSKLTAAIPFSKQLLLFSTQTQFAVESGDLLTPKTISIKPTTEFECNPAAKPQGMGRMVLFATPAGAYSGVREYFVDQDSQTNDAAEVTSHVPRYIPKGIFKLAAGLNEDMLCVLTKGDRAAIYVYKFYWSNNEKLQSSWSRWSLDIFDQVLNVDFVESVMYLAVNRVDGLYLESLDVSAEFPEEGEPFLVHLDRKRNLPGQVLFYDEARNYTYVLPQEVGYFASGTPAYTAVATTGIPGAVFPVANDTEAGELRLIIGPGDLTEYDFVFGRRYAFRYQFSTIVPKTATSNGGEKADNTARLQLRNMQVNYSDTGYFKVEVTPQGRDTFTYPFTGKTLGMTSSIIGSMALATGTFRFPVRARNTDVKIEMVSDSPLPCAFLSADWEGMYAKRSQGI
nr:hypothetical protein [Pseudoduganella lutea]